MDRRSLFQSLAASIFGFLGFKTREPFAWVLTVTYKNKSDGTLSGPAYFYAQVSDKYCGNSNAEDYVRDLKNNFLSQNWSIEKQEIFPLYKD